MIAGIIIALRDSFNNGERFKELEILKQRIDEICIFCKQDYNLYVIYQDDKQLFNKAYLMNIGVYIAKDKVDYFIFHDVDTIPITNKNIYCERLYTGVLVGKDGDQILTRKDDHFAGAIYFNKKDFFSINGFSNYFWGWGFESYCTVMRLNKMNIYWDRYDGEFYQMVHETKHRYNGNSNFVNNVIISRQVDLKLMDGYSDIQFEINRVEDDIYYVKIPEPQYDVTKILTKEDILNMVGEFNEQDYNWIIETYSK